MSWSFLTRLLEEISLHSTYLGKLWLTTFLILRIMLTIAAGESIYHDEQSSFMCNSQQPGCTNVCYDSFAPLSYVRFWIFQIITVAAPSILYLAFAIHRIQRSEGSTGHKKHRRTEQAEENVQAEKGGEFADEAGEVKKNDHRWHDGRRTIPADGLMWAYTLQLVLRTVAEVGFLLGQYVMYGLEDCERRSSSSASSSSSSRGRDGGGRPPAGGDNAGGCVAAARLPARDTAAAGADGFPTTPTGQGNAGIRGERSRERWGRRRGRTAGDSGLTLGRGGREQKPPSAARQEIRSGGGGRRSRRFRRRTRRGQGRL
ncbi:gap junction gamma-1 protein-like isoform X3 [Petromyzon marinus]|uniref:gap junction gamma-1 protein-like isoform X3 n=1 Tax=Petromyzon marinus TaxID=7757 RepID=UPI003F70E4D3